MKNKFHREFSKRAMEILENTDYAKCTPEAVYEQFKRLQRQAFENDFGAVRDFEKGTVKVKQWDIVQPANYALDFTSLSQFILTSEDKQFQRNLQLMLRIGRYLRN